MANFNLIVRDEDNLIPKHPAVLQAVMCKLQWWSHKPSTFCLIATPSKDYEAEWLVIVDADDQGSFVARQSMAVGVIQRKAGDRVEFHS